MKKFYCQGCGGEVPLKSDFCPHCFKEFDQVLCPMCNYRGRASKFRNGCPSCGYLRKKEEITIDLKEKKKPFNLSLKIFITLLAGLLSIITLLLFLLIKN